MLGNGARSWIGCGHGWDSGSWRSVASRGGLGPGCNERHTERNVTQRNHPCDLADQSGESLHGLLGAVTPPAQTMEAFGLHRDLHCLSPQRNLCGCRAASGSCADSVGRGENWSVRSLQSPREVEPEYT
jgi:hypothetical protein